MVQRPPGKSGQFTQAICRLPAPSITQGLRAQDRGAPSWSAFLADHACYVAALEEEGVEVHLLDPLPDFPDSVFVEDPALILNGHAITLRPGAASRAGEADQIAPDLARLTHSVSALPEGHVDGGDVLTLDDAVWVGLSARTDRQGAEALRPFCRAQGYALRIVETPPEILHFKTECGILAPGCVIATPRLTATGCFDGIEVIQTAPGEDAAANAVRVNESVFLAEGFPATAARLEQAGFTLRLLPNAQAALVDGGLSCLSLRYSL